MDDTVQDVFQFVILFQEGIVFLFMESFPLCKFHFDINDDIMGIDVVTVPVFCYFVVGEFEYSVLVYILEVLQMYSELID